MLAHQKMYQTIEFGWAYLSDLSLRETYLIETYLDKMLAIVLSTMLKTQLA